MPYDDRDYYRGDRHAGGGGFRGFLYQLLYWLNYTFPIGTYLDIAVRVHVMFILLPLYFWGVLEDFGLAMRWTFILFLSVLLHEFGHCLGCRSVGGRADRVLMWPLGGLAFCDAPRRPWAEFVTVACGPLVSLLIAAGCYLALLLSFRGAEVLPVSLHPLAPLHYMPEGVSGLLVDFFVTNYMLLLFNLLLVFYPFDGGRLVQVAIWKCTSYPTSMVWATRVGMVGAVLVALFGIATRQSLLIVIAVFGFLTCYQQGKMVRYEGAAEPWRQSLYDQPEEGGEGWMARWRSRRADRRKVRLQARRAKLEAEVDRILDKVRDQGMHSLTRGEKKTLQRATERRRRAS